MSTHIDTEVVTEVQNRFGSVSDIQRYCALAFSLLSFVVCAHELHF